MPDRPTPDTILQDALDLAGSEERAAYLDEACRGDDALREEVESLLAAHFAADAFMDTLVDPFWQETAGEKVGDHIGRYKLLQQIGEGGFGTVYLAEQTEPVRRRVALKVIKAGMDSKEVIARFEAERQALALMDHPNIAKVHDAGTTEGGRPYFVMELVKGVPLTDYCRDKDFDTKARLELFMDVCSAVQHAHQKGIIHRDLKPSNILVSTHDGKPIVKVIDFGIAKAISMEPTEKTIFTQLGRMIGTPQYMSPEQAELNALDVDTRSDIYSLGVVLYELLTGTTPLDGEQLRSAAYGEMQRLIREETPMKPSTRVSTFSKLSETSHNPDHKTLRGDLDWIVMKALEKERERRYETANGFAADIRRFLKQEPVSAGPPGIGYKMRKFVRRNRTAVAVGSTIALLLIAGIFGTSWFAVSAQQAEKRERGAKELAIESDQKTGKARDVANKRLKHIQLKQAESHIENGQVPLGLAYLARVLRDDPSNPVAAERLTDCLVRRIFLLPLFAPIHHEEEVSSAKFSPDGSRIVSVSRDNTARIWNARTGSAIGVLMHHDAAIRSVEFSRDGLRLVTASDDKSAQIWDALTGLPVGEPLLHADAVVSASFRADGLRVITGSTDKTARIWDTRTSQPVGDPMRHPNPVLSVVYSPDGLRVAVRFGTSGTCSAHLWDAATCKPVGKHIGYTVGTNFFGLTFSPDGTLLMTPFFNGDTRIWDARTGQLLPQNMRHPEGNKIVSAEFSPDGKRVVTASWDKSARIWDTKTSEPVGVPMLHEWRLTSAHFSQDGERVVTISEDKTARIWDAKTGLPLCEPLRHQGTVISGQFSPDGKLLLTAAGRNVRLWDARTWKPLRAQQPMRHPHEVRCAEFSPDGRRVVTATGSDWRSNCRGTARIWDASTGELLGSPMVHEGSSRSLILTVQFSPDGLRVVTACSDGTARIWDGLSGKPMGDPLRHEAWVWSAHFDVDGKRIVTASADGTARLWDGLSGKPLGNPMRHEAEVRSAQFSKDGKRIVTASVDKTARIWDARSCLPLGEMMRHDDAVLSAQFSPDAEGRRVVTASMDKMARIWDSHTGRLLTRLPHQDSISSAIFSPDGQRVMTSSLGDNTVRIWDAHTGLPTGDPLRYPGRGEIRSSQFSADGQRVATTSWHHARIWDAASGLPMGEPLDNTFTPGANPPEDRFFSARFSPDGERIVTASLDGTARIWSVPRAPLPVPSWVASWAEAVGEIRISAEGVEEELSPNKLFAIRKQILSSTDTDFYTRAAKWFFADRDLRTNSPWSTECSHLDTHLKDMARLAWSGSDADYADRCKRTLATAADAKVPQVADAVAKSTSLRQTGDTALQDASLGFARMAAEKEPANARYQMTLGMAEYRRGSYQAAISALNQAIEMAEHAEEDPDPTRVVGTASFYLTMCLVNQNRGEEAKTLFRAAETWMKPLPAAGDYAPFVANPDDLPFWLAYKEAAALLEVDELKVSR